MGRRSQWKRNNSRVQIWFSLIKIFIKGDYSLCTIDHICWLFAIILFHLCGVQALLCESESSVMLVSHLLQSLQVASAGCLSSLLDVETVSSLVEREKLICWSKVATTAENWFKTAFVSTTVSLSGWECSKQVHPEALQDFGNHLHQHLPRAMNLVAGRLLLLPYQAPGTFLSPFNDLCMSTTKRTLVIEPEIQYLSSPCWCSPPTPEEARHQHNQSFPVRSARAAFSEYFCSVSPASLSYPEQSPQMGFCFSSEAC